MTKIIKTFRAKSDFLFGEGISEERIRNAEEALGLKFANDYKEYLLHFGIVAYDGHELTGIYSSTRLDVSNVTISERQNNTTVSNNMYVIEVANIDGIIVWQSTDGDIYETVMDSEPIWVCQSLVDYVNL